MAIPLSGMKIYESPLMLKEVERQVEKSFHERWIFPILNCVTVPFEPWVKTKTVVIMEPSDEIIKTPYGLFMHPQLAKELRSRIPSDFYWRRSSQGLGEPWPGEAAIEREV